MTEPNTFFYPLKMLRVADDAIEDDKVDNKRHFWLKTNRQTHDIQTYRYYGEFSGNWWGWNENYRRYKKWNGHNLSLWNTEKFNYRYGQSSMVRTGSSTGIYCNENLLKSIGSVYVIHTNHIKPNVPHIKFGQKRSWGLHWSRRVLIVPTFRWKLNTYLWNPINAALLILF